MPTDINPDNVSLALLLTAAGATLGAGIVTTLVEMVKRTVPIIVRRDWEVRLAFLVALLLVIAAYASGVQTGTLAVSFESLFAAFIAWLGIARLSMAWYDDATAQPGSLTGPATANSITVKLDPAQIDAIVASAQAELAKNAPTAAV